VKPAGSKAERKADAGASAIARLEAAHPDVEVRLELLEEPEELGRLRSGDLDLAVGERAVECRYCRGGVEAGQS
jgi:hypothetical protein